MISIESRDAFGGFTFAAFSPKKYSSGSDDYDQSIPEGVFNVFLPIKATHFIVYFSKAYDVVLVVAFHWRVFYVQPEKCNVLNIHKHQWQWQQVYQPHRHKTHFTVLKAVP